MSLADQVKNRREAAKLSQRDLGAQAGLSEQYVWQLETGRIKSPAYDTLRKLAGVLGCVVEELAEDETNAGAA